MKQALFALLLLVAACSSAPEKIQLKEISFDTIRAWKQDRHAEALNAFIRSCNKPKATKDLLRPWIDKQAWKQVCESAERLEDRSPEAVRHFFETRFTPYHLSSNRRTEGRLTGYYIPVIEGALKQSKRYPYPAYGVPSDLTRPYFSREEIENGALQGKGLELAWFESPVMPFFMQIQGSGRVHLPNGKFVDLLYADKNGHAYTPIGRTLLKMGALTRKNISMQSIRQWLYDHPDQASEVMNSNASYVFFHKGDAEKLPVGSQGVPLTPERSLAIDHSILPYGLPVFIETMTGFAQNSTKSFAKLLITQDRGGAIKGALRGDLFFGQGAQAEARAGKQNNKGRWVVLIPTKVDDE